MTLEAMAAPLFQHEPRTEQEVVCLFGAMIGDLGMPLVIEQVQAGFPDCTVRRTDTNERIRIEFELYGSHFRGHGYPFDGCDMVVCWLDDAGTWPAGFRVLELADAVATRRPDLIDTVANPDNSRPWDERAFVERATTDGASRNDIALAKAIIAYAKREGLGPQWLVNPSAVFAVGPDVQYFKVYATGLMRLPFSRLPPHPQMPHLFSRLRSEE